MNTARIKLSQFFHRFASATSSGKDRPKRKTPARRRVAGERYLTPALFVPLVSGLFLLCGTVAQAVQTVPEITVDSLASTSPIAVSVTFKPSPGIPGAPGLTGGSLGGNMNMGANPGNLGVDPLGPSNSESNSKPPWADNLTFVYTGYIFDADGVMSFREDIDDGAWLKVDGQQLLEDSAWNTVTTKAVDLGRAQEIGRDEEALLVEAIDLLLCQCAHQFHGQGRRAAPPL